MTEQKVPLTPDKAAKEAVKETEPKESAVDFPVERLLAESDVILGEPGHVVAGALAAVARKTLTVEEAKAAIKAWLKSPEKTEET